MKPNKYRKKTCTICLFPTLIRKAVDFFKRGQGRVIESVSDPEVLGLVGLHCSNRCGFPSVRNFFLKDLSDLFQHKKGGLNCTQNLIQGAIFFQVLQVEHTSLGKKGVIFDPSSVFFNAKNRGFDLHHLVGKMVVTIVSYLIVSCGW